MRRKTKTDYVCGVGIKGGWEIDESIEEAALRETVEEAGVVGDVQVASLLHF